MNEKKSNGFAALILSVVVALAAVFGVKFAGGSAAVKETSKDPSAPVENQGSDNQGEAAGKYTAGTYTAEAQGMGKITVTVTVDADAITEVKIDAPDETPGIGVEAAEKLQAAIMEAQSAEVDVISGASITSNAVISAVQDCLTQAASGAGAPAGSGGDAAPAGKYKAGTYTEEAQGMGKLTVTVTVGEDGAIADVQIDASNETPGIGVEAAEKLQSAIVDAQSAEVDSISGATITSGAVIEAVTACLEQAAAN